jgi:hypothetical protein
MHYYRIRNHIICLEDVYNVEPDFSKLIIHFKNGTSVSIYFSDCDRQDEVVDELWQRLINMRK